MSTIEKLPVKIPEYPGTNPFSRGSPTFYRPEDLHELGDVSEKGKTPRTEFFERTLVALFWRLGRPVPYAFITYDDRVRSLDAGCLKFLLNRRKPELRLIVDNSGQVSAVEPTHALLDRYIAIRTKLVGSLDLNDSPPPIALPFDINAPADERRKVESDRVVREGALQFRNAVLAAWGLRCAFSGVNVEAVIDAAHIYRYLGPKTNDVRNGLPLRTDLHRLFEKGLLTLEYRGNDLVLLARDELRGSEYAGFDGRVLSLPHEKKHWPDRRLVDHHRAGGWTPSG